MPCPKSIVSMLCTVLLMSAVIVSAHPYFSESSYLEGVFNRRNDMNALSMQAGQTCPMSGACEVCQTTQIGSRDLHICPGDGDRCNPTPCVYTSACRCSSRTLQLPSNLLKCNSNTTAVIEGVPVKINIIEYAVITPGPDPDFTCFATEPFTDTCTEECNSMCTYTEICTNNTLSGDLTSCNGSNGCVCKPEYLQPNCCNCDIASGLYYLPDCDPFCRQNCASPRPGEIGGCAECNEGYGPAPICCNCTSGYTKNLDGRCVKNVCTNNCVGFQPQTGECSSCTGGFILPTCCECPPEKRNINGICRCEPNYKNDGSEECNGGFVPPTCCDCPPDKTEVNGICVCESNFKTDGSGECAGGFVLPTCCDCPPGKTEVNGICVCESNFKTDGSGECAGGFALPTCCDCPPGKKEVNGICVCESNFKTNGSGECAGGFAPPTCCDCPPGKKEVDGICVCESNFKADGSGECAGGFVAPTCCDCPPDKENVNGTCRCKANIKTDGSGECKEGYESPECCECRSGYTKKNGICEPDCSINQNIYFLLDGTNQNYAFCTFGITIHMLVAAFNPGSSTSGTRLSTVLFPRNGISNVVFGTSNSCDEIKSKIPVLQTQMQTCQDIQQTDKSSITYTSLCGSATAAVNGLKEILSLIPNPASTPSAVVILTDGQIDDLDSERNEVLKSLENPNLKVQTIISGGITDSGATETNLKHYNRNNFKNDGFVLTKDAISLGVGLVRKMESVGLICPELANEIVKELGNVQNTKNGIKYFCQCHNTRVLDALDKKNKKCVVTYPKCGGSLSTGAKAQPKQQESLSYLEEEILAAIENVMERFED